MPWEKHFRSTQAALGDTAFSLTDFHSFTKGHTFHILKLIFSLAVRKCVIIFEETRGSTLKPYCKRVQELPMQHKEQ